MSKSVVPVGSFGNAQGVYATAASASHLYIGGIFSSVEGVAARNIARFDGTTWSSLAGTTAQGVNDSVSTILPSGNAVYVGDRSPRPEEARSIISPSGMATNGMR